MPDTTSNNKRIAKNTMFLYFRMLLVMLVSLYTTRVLLRTLGVEDFGIYNVVGGIVTMFSFLSGTLSTASQRFLSRDIGKNDFEKLNKTFSMVIIIHVIISIVIIMVAETLGLWFVNEKMTIPDERVVAANWVYHFTILSFIVTVLSTPYNAAIISQEKMGVYAFVSVIEVILKLIIVYLLVVFSFDHLKLYAVLQFLVTICVQLIYVIYCKKHYVSYKFKYYWNRDYFYEILSFSGWNMWGAIAAVLKNQGVNILLNMFFNPIVNAANGIAHQIRSAILSLATNFSTAYRPAIYKCYSIGDYIQTRNLLYSCTKISYFLLLFFSLPLLFQTDFILGVWLEEFPKNTILFTKLIVVDTLFEALNIPISTCVQANGNIRKYQLWVSGLSLLNLPISYVLLQYGFQPELIFVVAIVVSFFSLSCRLLIGSKLVRFRISEYLGDVIIPLAIVTSLQIFISCFIGEIDGLLSFCIYIINMILLYPVMVFSFGLNSMEKLYIKKIIKKKNESLFCRR